MIWKRCGLATVLVVLLAEPGRADGIAIRVEAAGFGASEADIGAVCRSAADCLTAGWRQPPEARLVVVKGEHGPITLFARNDRGELVVRLDTGKTYWAQYAYQFSHELCHVLCKCEDDYRGNLWFEETLCETASMYCMRRMSGEWRDKAPYPNWQDYAPALGDYARDVIRKRALYPELVRLGLPAFYQKHRARIEAEPCDREINGAMAIVLLNLFESDPQQWEAIRWLNPSPSPEGEDFQAYLRKWHDAAPEVHRGFIAGIAGIFGVAW